MITKGLEDYLELIYNTISKGDDIKAVDIANKFNISRPSVSEALIRLADSDLIIYEGRKGIQITEKGIIAAQKVAEKHNTLFTFFNKVLNITQNEANENACKIEHVIDDYTTNQIKKFTDFCLRNQINTTFKDFQSEK